MTNKNLLQAMGHIDSQLIADAAPDIPQKRSTNKTWVKWASIAACFALIISAVVVVPMLKDSEDNPIIDPMKNNVLSISLIKSGNKISGKQEILYGDPSSGNEGESEMIFPGFYINTVIQANVIEVLPDYYYTPDLSIRYLVAKLSVVEAIRGSGLPNEILMRFPYYTSDIFDGYDTFILSLQQIGVENYMMINDTKREVTYFPNMFEVERVKDLGYGSVIAFKDGKVDTSFFEKANHNNTRLNIANFLQDPSLYFYPVSLDTTLDEAKANIKELSQKSNEESMYVSDKPCDYFTVDDIFVSNEGKQIKSYLEPSEMSVFMQDIYPREDRVVAIYTRVINGLVTEETVKINGYTGVNGNVNHSDTKYNENDLSKIPNICEALENMNLSELTPPHIEIEVGMNFKYSSAMGVYRKVGDKVFGIVRIMWYYTYPERTNGYIMDDCYYLYDQDGNGSIVERDELKELIGDDYIIARFSYNEYIAFEE